MWKTLLLAFASTFLFSLVALHLFPKIGLMDRPKRYGLSRKPIPYPGGVAIFLGVVLTTLAFVPLESSVIAMLSGATILAVTSFVDDRRGLSPYFRLIIQVLAGVIVVLGGLEIASVTHPFGGSLDLTKVTYLADVVTVLWVMVMVNAFNWLDGVPGMSSSISAITAVVLLLLSMRPEFHYFDQTLAIALSSIVLGAALAFLIFDFPKPRMIMGDTGSMLLGFLLAVAAIISGAKIATTILVLGFPLLDFAWVIGRRVWQGKSPFKGDLWHFHHRFLKAGLSERQVVLFFAAAAALFGLVALMLNTGGKLVATGVVLLVMTLLAFLLYERQL